MWEQLQNWKWYVHQGFGWRAAWGMARNTLPNKPSIKIWS